MSKVKSVYRRASESRAKFASNITEADVQKTFGTIRQQAIKTKYDSYNEMFNVAGKIGEITTEIGEAKRRQSEIEQGVDLASRKLGVEGTFDRKNQQFTFGDKTYSTGDMQALYKKNDELELDALLGIERTDYKKKEEDPQVEKLNTEFKPFKFKSLFDTLGYNN
tara:strand:+ start:95 stop:589 length:495 start_codon:yes stop_codon:yes gene_type:complete